LAGGMRDLWALLAISFGAFVTVTVVQEFWRGVRARHRQYGEALLLALGRLVARNRRRYGGYVVHIGIVMLFVAFSGMAFKTETRIMSRLREDLYGVLGGVVNGTEQAVFRFTINPLVWWVWYGGMVVALGGLLVMWPGGGVPATKRSQAGYAVRLVGQA